MFWKSKTRDNLWWFAWKLILSLFTYEYSHDQRRSHSFHWLLQFLRQKLTILWKSQPLSKIMLYFLIVSKSYLTYFYKSVFHLRLSKATYIPSTIWHSPQDLSPSIFTKNGNSKFIILVSSRIDFVYTIQMESHSKNFRAIG